jgi:hypothetical protein
MPRLNQTSRPRLFLHVTDAQECARARTLVPMSDIPPEFR